MTNHLSEIRYHQELLEQHTGADGSVRSNLDSSRTSHGLYFLCPLDGEGKHRLSYHSLQSSNVMQRRQNTTLNTLCLPVMLVNIPQTRECKVHKHTEGEDSSECGEL